MGAEIEDDERWPIPPERRSEIVDFLFQTMRLEEPKDGLTAAKTLIGLDKVNSEQEDLLANLTFEQLRLELARRIESLQAADGPTPPKARVPLGIDKKAT